MEFKELETIIKLFQNSNLDKLEWKKGDEQLTLNKDTKAKAALNPSPALLSSATSADKEDLAEISYKQESPAKDNDLHYISAPFVGTFYRSPSPDVNPFVSIGDEIKKGQTLCIVEAMKLMNEIEADIAGTIVDIMVENAHPVEFGSNIFAIRPKGK
ncbi:MAG: acetyl-CoA carboxylase biotin carboxyl carrier protein [SAR324 cluster bacterium]|nr:acetyl-CoA carboxylase biotin carboxyl carrier protein [SAR324 cluster bacterium]